MAPDQRSDRFHDRFVRGDRQPRPGGGHLAQEPDEVGNDNLFRVPVAKRRPACVDRQSRRLVGIGGGEVEGDRDGGDDLRLPLLLTAAARADQFLELEVKRNGPESMPELAPMATYMTLAPFIGAEEAYERATEESDKW
jgi:hypothetical protein